MCLFPHPDRIHPCSLFREGPSLLAQTHSFSEPNPVAPAIDFVFITSFNPHPLWLIIPILLMGKLRPRLVADLAQGPPAGKRSRTGACTWHPAATLPRVIGPLKWAMLSLQGDPAELLLLFTPDPAGCILLRAPWAPFSPWHTAR